MKRVVIRLMMKLLKPFKIYLRVTVLMMKIQA